MQIHNFIPNEARKIGLLISGGLDSSLMLYLITKEIKEKNSNVEFITYTVEQELKGTVHHTKKIINIIEELNNISITNIIVGASHAHTDYEIIYGTLDALNRERKSNQVLDVLYLASTKVPEELKNVNGAPRRDGRNIFSVVQPWSTVNKDEIVSYILKNNLLELVKNSHSCTMISNKHCGECWNCIERIWAFDKNNAKSQAF